MAFSRRQRVILEIIISITLLVALGVGISLGLAVASIRNIDVVRELRDYRPSLPTQILDRDGKLITELFGEEKREMIHVDELPKHLVYAVLTREDRNFYNHSGFDFIRTTKAAIDMVRGRFSGGGSTITQQVAGRLFADRSSKTIERKIRELWYAFLLERSFTKNEILELYINQEFLGHGTYGVEAASQLYFGHSAREVSIAEAAILVPLFSAPSGYSPILHPEAARDRQRFVLDQMIQLGYVEKKEADDSFRNFWDSWDYTRSSSTSAYLSNESQAPYFSEYIRQQLEDLLFGSVDIYKDGYIVHTTLDLEYQRIADSVMQEGIRSINQRYRASSQERLEVVDTRYVPLLDLASLAFNIENIKVAGARQRREAKESYLQKMNPLVDMVAMSTGSKSLKDFANRTYDYQKAKNDRSIIEGALITLENETGHILSMVGGSDFETTKLNRAVQSRLQPGSAFKPLYYSAAISSGKFTPATRLYDGPIVFWNADGTPYEPQNYLGDWQGSVLLRVALATSMNVPSIQVLDGVGFDAAIERASRLLGMYDQRNNEDVFPRRYPLGLGIVSVAPINMARAFATFPNAGKEVIPIGITYIQDRQGNMVLEHEKELLSQRKGRDTRILSPQAAFVMVDLLESTVEFGTLANRRRNIGGFDGMPMAGKTGTTQNWGDAWTVGFSPYMTTAVWFGFDMPGNSLGRLITGATAAGPIWAQFMKDVHKGLEPKAFFKPDSGIVTVRVCSVSGQLPTQECNEGIIEEIFIAGTEPREACEIHQFRQQRDEVLLKHIQDNMLIQDFSIPDTEFPELTSPFGDDDQQKEPLFDNPGSSESFNPLLD
ncbi:PBP1A family penicillin-binding protein [Marispirochaeta sp.]|uniref:penicillin-binding protein 1A n=1 Tax=Marispirochaeta sp. TaxID=2038653 RepID=UPI0029C8B76A|nr:PBP1A family penicillin-binding protein [Marispirochaeta sp.]